MYGTIARGLISAALAGGATPDAAAPGGPLPVVEHGYVIALDPGHGGDNQGCLAADGHTREKVLTLRLARELRGKLQRRIPSAQIVLTRDADESISLAERVLRANDAHASLLVSLHYNASNGRDQTGFETYVLDAEESAAEAARASRRADDDGLLEATGDASAPRLMVRGLKRHSDREAAMRLAEAIQAQQAQRFPERVDRGVQQASFDVLIGARMPAVLFEVGFIDNAKDASAILGAEDQADIVAGLADAIVEHYREAGR